MSTRTDSAQPAGSGRIKRRTRGTPTIDFRPRMKRLLYKALATGLPAKRACALIGMDYDNYGYYIVQGKLPGSQWQAYRAFFARVKRIEARREAELLQVIDTVAKGNYKVRDIEVSVDKNGMRSYKRRTRFIRPEWKAAAWRLERAQPADYAPKTQDMGALAPEDIAAELKSAADALFGSVPTEPEDHDPS